MRFLTRADDRYLKLRDRTKIAKKIMLIYLYHYMQTTIKSQNTRIIFLYTLEKASDKEAEALKERK